MKQALRLSLLFTLLFFCLTHTLTAQVINGDKYNIQVQFLRGFGQYEKWNVVAAPDENNLATNLGFSPTVLGVALNCYEKTRNNSWGPVANKNMFSLNVGNVAVETNGKYDYTVSAWNGGSNCIFENDNDLIQGFGVRDLRSDPNSQWTTWEGFAFALNRSSRFEVRHTARLSAGIKDDPLDFGTLNPFDTKTHNNQNRSHPSGSYALIGYANEWSGDPFTPGNDVTYKFKITGSRLVTISTDNAITDAGLGDSHICLVDSTSGNVIAYNDNGGTNFTSLMSERLCPGTYYIVVEGKTASDQGDFSLSISNQGISSANGPGSIAISANNSAELSICPNEDIPEITSLSEPTVPTSGVYNYVWKKSTYNSGTWSAWTTYEPAGNGASASDLGTIEDNEKVAFYREITDCNTVYKTDSVVFTKYIPTVSGGTVALNGSTMLPFPQELPDNGSFTSTVDATAFPNPTIVWEQKVNGGDWTAASGVNDGQTFDVPLNLTADLLFRRTVTNSCNGIAGYNGKQSSNETAIDIIFPDGRIAGRVTDINGTNGIDGVTVTATRITTVPGGVANKTYTTITTNGGQYTIPNLYYGDDAQISDASADFNVVPSRPGFEFDKVSQIVKVSTGTRVWTGIDFKNTVGFTITGVVTQECPDCDTPSILYLEGVNMLEDGTNKANETDENGKFTSIQLNQGTYKYEPVYETHQFDPAIRTVEVDGSTVEITGIDFKDTTTHLISGNVIKNPNCSDNYIGQASLTFSQVLPDKDGEPVAPVFVKTISTNEASGAYSVRLPAAKYRVEVNSISDIPNGKNLNQEEMLSFLNAYPDSVRVRDITNADTTLNLYFHERPQIVAVGLEGPCTAGTVAGTEVNSLVGKPIFEQSIPRTFIAKVFEGDASKNCPVQDTTLIVNTNIQAGDGNESITIETEDGEAEITLVGGIPNIIPPYHKTLSFMFTDIWNRTADNLVLTPVVTGARLREGSFSTVSPQIPFLILRDPPGDNSFSFWEENSSIQTAKRFYTSDGNSTDIWTNVRVGAEFSSGLGVTVNSKVWGDLGGSVAVSSSSTSADEAIVTLENSQYYSTSDAPNVIGDEGDVYIGAAMNFTYAVADEVNFSSDSCTLYPSKRLMISPDEAFLTEYAYTEGHILNSLIPTLETIRDQPGNSQTEIDSLQNQISVWQQIIENNKKLKREAQFSKNISFDGAAGAQTSTTTSSSTGTSSVEFTMQIDTGVALELGVEVAGAGISGGVNTVFKMETGRAESTTTMQSTTVGFTIDDDDPGDSFTVDIKDDPVYNTPVFELVAGTSSCPHEAGTAPRDGISFTVAEPLKTGLTAGTKAFYDLVLGNNSESEEARTYFVRYLVSSGTGATVSIEGNGVGPFDYPVNYLENKPLTVSVEQFNPNVYSFEGLTFQAYDACSDGSVTSIDVSKEVQISAFYNSPCSPVTLASPENGFVVNTNSNNTLPLLINGYTYANLDNISLEYSKVGLNNWTTAFVLQKAQIDDNPFGTSRNFDVANLPDGEYNLRLKLQCGIQTVYSKRVTGVIDRTPPRPFGKPAPADDILSLGDEISHTFNEKLSCNSLTAANLTMTRLSSQTAVNASVGCFENKIIITPIDDVLSWLGDSVRVQLTNITDARGNTSPNTFTWDFVIGSPVLNSSTFLANVTTPGINSTAKPSEQPAVKTILANSKNEDALGTIDVDFTLNRISSNDIVVYYLIAGTATFGTDYTVSGAKTFDGQQGSITIAKGTTKRTLRIDPTADTDVELDESIILSLLSGGDYNIGGSNKVTLAILNDDTDDCENNGEVFVQENNAFGNTSLAAGTYHKALLESDAFVSSPTTVVFKGERSITLKPGFEVQNGSVFLATQEDCPNVASAAISSELPLLTTAQSDVQKASLVIAGASPQNNSFSEQNVFTNNSGIINIPFRSEDTQTFKIYLYKASEGLVQDLSESEPYEFGNQTLQFDTQDLETGEYFFSIQPSRVGQIQYHKLIVKD